MALKASNQIKTVYGTSVFSLQAHPGESLLVKGIRVSSAAGTYATLKTEKTTVGFFKIIGPYKNHLRSSIGAFQSTPPFRNGVKNILDILFDMGIFKGYPIAEGETFIFSGAEGASDIKSVLYDIYDPEDQKNTSPNGSKATEYMLINYGDTGAAIAAAGDFLYDNPLNPVEFPQFPYGDDVPAKHQITVHGILGSEVAIFSAGPVLDIYTKYLKLVKEREVLFDEDRNGIPFDGSISPAVAGTSEALGFSYIGDFTENDMRTPFIFETPLIFDAGDELNMYVTVLEPHDGSTITAALQVIGLIETIARVTGA